MNVHDTFCETLRLLGLNPHFILMDSATEKPVTDLTPKQWEELNKVATWVDQPQPGMSLQYQNDLKQLKLAEEKLLQFEIEWDGEKYVFAPNSNHD
jgi:hypothetical protein